MSAQTTTHFGGTRILIEFEAREILGSWKTYLPSWTFEPILTVVLLIAGLQGLTDAGTDYIRFVIPGLLTLQAVQEPGQTLVRANVDRLYNMLAMKRLAGVGKTGYASGISTRGVLSFTVRTLAIIPIAILLGASANILGWVLCFGIGLLVVAFWSGIAVLISALIKSYQQRDVILTFGLLPITFAAPVFYPLEDAPHYLQVIARFNPVTYQVEAMRKGYEGSLSIVAVVLAGLLAIAAVSLASLAIARGELLGSHH